MSTTLTQHKTWRTQAPGRVTEHWEANPEIQQSFPRAPTIPPHLWSRTHAVQNDDGSWHYEIERNDRPHIDSRKHWVENRPFESAEEALAAANEDIDHIEAAEDIEEIRKELEAEAAAEAADPNYQPPRPQCENPNWVTRTSKSGKRWRAPICEDTRE